MQRITRLITAHKAGILLAVGLVCSLLLVRKCKRPTPRPKTDDFEADDAIAGSVQQELQDCKSAEQQNPLTGKEQLIVSKFMAKLKQDTSLARFMTTNLQRNLKYAITEVMGGPFKRDSPRLDQLLSGMDNKQYEQWVTLWRQSQKAAGISGKNIWPQLRTRVIRQ